MDASTRVAPRPRAPPGGVEEAPSTCRYEPTTETYTPTNALAVIKYALDVSFPGDDAEDLIPAIPAYKELVSELSGVSPPAWRDIDARP